MNSDPTKTIPASPHERIAHLDQVLKSVVTAKTVEVGARFNLRRPGTQGIFFHDLSLVDGTATQAGFKRILVIDNQEIDLELHERLRRARVSVIPQLRDVHNEELVFFGVSAGLRLLTHEKLHGRDSSGTYIGDKEMFATLGELYGRAWAVTGSLILDPGLESDNPLNHVALRSFSENSKDLMALCPPYNTTSPLSVQDARELFRYTVGSALRLKGAGIKSTQPLLEASFEAFWHAQNQKQ